MPKKKTSPPRRAVSLPELKPSEEARQSTLRWISANLLDGRSKFKQALSIISSELRSRNQGDVATPHGMNFRCGWNDCINELPYALGDLTSEVDEEENDGFTQEPDFNDTPKTK